jgi:rhodanese-related sulfurtransferase
MDPLLLAGLAAGLAVVVLLLLLATRAKLATLEERLTDMSHASATREADEGEEKESVEGLRKLVAMMAAGKPVDAEMVRENRLYRTAKVADIIAERDAGREPYVIDVRSTQEWAGGHIAGALHIPVDDIQKRLHEVARDGRKTFVICAGGGRSQAAATFLANRGFLNIHNVEGGMNSWKGPVERT